MNSPARTVATLASAPDDAAVSHAAIERAKQALAAFSTREVEIVGLAPGVAADLFFDLAPDATREGATRALRDALGAEPIDAIVQPTAFRRKKLLIADMDSTMIGQECIDELADMAGLRLQVAAITERAMRGEIAFEPALRERVGLLRGLEDSVVAKVIAERITLTPGGAELVATMRANGAHTALISGGFTLFTRRIAEALGFHEHRANALLVEDGRFSGFVGEPILGRQAKLAALLELRELRGLRKEETLAVGDGANDLAMLEEAGLGIAYHAKPAVAAAAHARIEHADLTALLYAQGYRRNEFTSSSI